MASHDLAAIDAFLAEPHNVIVGGIRRNGRPHMTPNWFLWEDGRFYVSTTRDRAKYRIFANDPRVQLTIDDPAGFRYLMVDGAVDIHEDVDSGLRYFRELRAKHGRDSQSDDELRAEMVRDGRVLLVITPDRDPADWHGRGFTS